MAAPQFHEFASRDELAEVLSDRIAELLNLDFTTGAFASIAMSGGTAA